jgi:hypothetical protein
MALERAEQARMEELAAKYTEPYQDSDGLFTMHNLFAQSGYIFVEHLVPMAADGLKKSKEVNVDQIRLFQLFTKAVEDSNVLTLNVYTLFAKGLDASVAKQLRAYIEDLRELVSDKRVNIYTLGQGPMANFASILLFKMAAMPIEQFHSGAPDIDKAVTATFASTATNFMRLHGEKLTPSLAELFPWVQKPIKEDPHKLDVG